ncbi:MAG: response regulator [Nitrospina sp.]|mgnify:CR=1 FL=1|jgi:light-regulated signal transduction histidine kinase (bacteriophytochrome)|nr:response regulator [Nitrospina sp.]MBT3508058.1 response regulator [Nitrospina sp.]MBT3876689.1 response regulator [Nitrospina sp.]MBT4049604.1 response regulator [Nitrospina sp.]MBT4558316.1 response regulator [Nitrospina sp.]
MSTIKNKINVLIIDDCPEDLFVYKNFLQKNEEITFIIEECETGEEGMETCKTSKPDCLLLDYNLPDLDGLEILSELAPLSFPVIMLTGEGTQQIAVQALKNGAQDYLIKGEITPSNLTQSIITAVKMFKIESERQRFAEELKRSNQALEDFANIASHDLQEPLRKIHTYAEKIKELSEGVIDERCRDYLNRLQSSTERMSQFIEDLLKFSMVTTTTKPFKPVDLNGVIKLVLSDLEITILNKQAQVNIMQLPVIETDRSQIYQLFLNLVANGLKFNKSDTPVIDITCQKGTNNYWEIRVKDNGIGLENKFKEKIFKPFFRIHGRSDYKGTGTGLAICKKLVERHHGTISVESEPEKGTTFIIILPEKNSQEEQV